MKVKQKDLKLFPNLQEIFIMKNQWYKELHIMLQKINPLSKNFIMYFDGQWYQGTM